MGSRRQPGPASEAVRDVLEATADLLHERQRTDAADALIEVIHGKPAMVLLRSTEVVLHGAARQAIADELRQPLMSWCRERTPAEVAAMLRRAARRAGAAR